MKKTIFRTVAFSALLFVGVNAANAQRSYDCPTLTPENQAMADNVINLNMEDPEKANKEFIKLSKKIKKNKEDLVAVGTYFLDHDNYPAALQCSKAVYEADPTYIPGLMFQGEVMMKAQNWGAAGQKFDEVLNIDPENVNALKRNAFVYKNVNPYVAIDALNKIKEIDPTYTLADKDLGDIYYKQDKYAEAVKNYETYYSNTPKDSNLDINACENFLQSLYSQAQFDRISEITSEVLPLAPKDIVIRRMDFFAKVNKIGEAIDYDGAIKSAEEASAYLTDPTYADTSFISVDHEYAAALAKEKGDIPAAIDAYTKAIKADPKKASSYKEISTLYARNKQAELGVEAFKTYIELQGDKVDLSDKFLLGTKYMAAFQQEDIEQSKREQYFNDADQIFKAVMAQKPDFVPAIASSARLNNRDSQTPNPQVLALYKQLLEVSEAEADKYTSYRFEASRYIFFYAVSVEPADKALANQALTIAKSIDPESQFVKDAEGFLKTL